MASWLVLVSFAMLVSATVGQTNISAEPGENVTLPCRTPNNRPAVVVEWRRNDTGVVKDVALYRGGRFDENGQDLAYKNRVDLQDREMKDGDVSLVLMNVTANHTGTYECRVYQKENKRKKRSDLKGDPICIIGLDAPPPRHPPSTTPPPSGDKGELQEDGGNKDRGNEDGGKRAGLIAGVIVGVIVVVLASVGGFLLYRNRQSSRNQNPPATETELGPINTENNS